MNVCQIRNARQIAHDFDTLPKIGLLPVVIIIIIIIVIIIWIWIWMYFQMYKFTNVNIS